MARKNDKFLFLNQILSGLLFTPFQQRVKIHSKFASQMDFYLLNICFCTDLAVNAKSCLNSNLSGCIFPAFVQNSVIYFIRCDILLKNVIIFGKGVWYGRKGKAPHDITAIEEGFNAYLKKPISIRDTNTKKEMKENFYHGILLGLFGNMEGWDVQSNAESGDGYSDISIEIEDEETGIIIELKYAEKAAFDTACREALKQINDRNYEEKLIDGGMTTIRKYGIACYKRRCKVISG